MKRLEQLAVHERLKRANEIRRKYGMAPYNGPFMPKESGDSRALSATPTGPKVPAQGDDPCRK